MNIACTVQSVIPGWLLRAFRVPSDVCTRVPGVTAAVTRDQRQAWETYDNLHGSPDTVLSIPMYDRNGNRTVVNKSIAQLSLLSSDHASRKQALERALATFTENGWFVPTKLPESERGAMLTGQWRGARGSLERSSLVYDADKCLDMPPPPRNGAPRFYSSNDPARLPEWFPKTRLESHALYPTPRLLSNEVPSQAIRAAFEALCVAIHRHLEARNVSLRFHPAIIAALMPHNVDSRFADPALWYPYTSWRDSNGNPEYYFRNTVNHAVVTPYAEGGGWRFTNAPLWFRSLDTRAQAVILDSQGAVTAGVYDMGSESTSFQVNEADAIVDIVRMVNVARHLLVTDSVDYSQRVLIDQHAAMTVKQNLQGLALRHAGISATQNLTEALEAARIERDGRYNRGLSTGLGIAGYESTGDTGADITALTVDSLGLALQTGLTVAAGNPIAGVVAGVVMFVVRFAVGLIGYFSAPDRPRDPLTLPFRILRGNDTPWSGGAVRDSIALPIGYNFAISEPTTYRGLP